MAYIVSGTDLTAVANAIRTAGETSAPLEFPDGFVEAIGDISGGGGGATNFVHGSFTAESTEKGSVKTISLPYTGSGYPIALHIYPKDGAYKSGSDMYLSTQYKAIVQFVMTKNNIGEAPDYGTSFVEKNQASVVASYKNSGSDASQIAPSGARDVMEYTSYNANGSVPANSARFKSATTLGVFIQSTDYGFQDGIEYAYDVVYSS